MWFNLIKLLYFKLGKGWMVLLFQYAFNSEDLHSVSLHIQMLREYLKSKPDAGAVKIQFYSQSEMILHRYFLIGKWFSFIWKQPADVLRCTSSQFLWDAALLKFHLQKWLSSLSNPFTYKSLALPFTLYKGTLISVLIFFSTIQALFAIFSPFS